MSRCAKKKRPVWADPDAAFLIKNGEILYGFKMISTVNGRGFIKKFFLRPANEGDSPHFAELMKDDTEKKGLCR